VGQDFSIRPATPADARAIAEVQVATWKTTYRGILPDALLDNLSADEREPRWRERLSTAPEVMLVARDTDGKVVGFVGGGAERTGTLGCDGELHAIYLLERVQRQGLGTLLVNQLVRELRSRGFTSMAVWVLAANPFRKFYGALGGKVIAEREHERGGQQVTEVAYGWRDLNGIRGSGA
jgi:GNAT superfamily N-acetyltransferase